VAEEKLDQDQVADSEAIEGNAKEAGVGDTATDASAAQDQAVEGALESTHAGQDHELSADGVVKETLDEQVAQLQSDLEQAKDMALRAQADAQNIKRRAEQDVEKARKYALERFSGELLPVVDNLERALEAAHGDEEAVKPIAEGVELTLKNLLDVLKKFQVEPVDPVGEPFDPNLHQAMSMVENPDAEPNTVLTVMQKGYTLNGRLIRPAMVMVSKAPAAG